MFLPKAIGLRADNKLMASCTRRLGGRHRHNWYTTNVSRPSEFRHLTPDTDAWKTFVHARLATTAGGHGAMTLFG